MKIDELKKYLKDMIEKMNEEQLMKIYHLIKGIQGKES